MTTPTQAAQAVQQDPLSDEYVNAVIRRHGYDSPECVIARLHQWIGLHGGENGVTLLMYEAHKALSALSKLRAPVADGPLAVQALKAAQNNIAACRPPGSSDPKSPQYDHDAFMWDYYQRAIDSLALASASVTKPLTQQNIFDKFSFLEGLVNERTYRKIAETAIELCRANAPSAPQASAEALDALTIDLDYADGASVQIEVHGTEKMLRRLEAWLSGERSRIGEQVRNAALEEAIEAVTTLHEGDDAVYLPDIAKAIETLKSTPAPTAAEGSEDDMLTIAYLAGAQAEKERAALAARKEGDGNAN
ncbi:hypothetical protein ACXXCT_08565 [Bordetella bronchiseptica]